MKHLGLLTASVLILMCAGLAIARDGDDASEHVYEVVLFTAAKGVTVEQMESAAEAILPTLEKQPGFLERELSFDAEKKTWLDIVTWASMKDAKAAFEAITTKPSDDCIAFFPLIDQPTIRSFHMTSRFRQ